MKIRREFVTNSSSCSYVVILCKDVTEEDVDKLIEDNKHTLFNEEVIPKIKEYLMSFKEKYNKYENVSVKTESCWDFDESIESMLADFDLPNWLIIESIEG